MPSGTYTVSHKKKISESLKRFWLTFDATARNKKISKTKMGHIVSLETRKRIARTRRERKIPSPTLGKKRSAETIRKIKLHHKGMGGKKHSIETRIKMSAARTGSKSHFWKGGLTAKHLTIRESIKYKLWREAIFKRDSYTCQRCGKRNGNGKTIVLNADHIKPFAYFPKLRFKLSNGTTLCVPCHKKTDTYGEKAKKYKK